MVDKKPCMHECVSTELIVQARVERQ